MKKRVLFGLLSVISVSVSAQQVDDVKMFPTPKNGFVQKVIRLKPKKMEENYLVEILIGKKAEVDACNRFFLGGNLEENNLDGWGYNYYIFTTDGVVGGTLMACADNKKLEKIVYAPSQKVSYNSSLPLVVYVPSGYQVDYRIWSASNKIYTAN